MELREQFEKAVADSKYLNKKPSNETLLKLYSLYKQSTEGDINIDPPTNQLDFISKAKYEAWTALKGTTIEVAMSYYVDLINKLQDN